MDSISGAFNSLTHVRKLTGQAQSSVTYTLIQDTVEPSLSPLRVLYLTTIGLGSIVNAFKEASLYYTLTNGRFGPKRSQAASDALAFIQGTGLEITIQTFALQYDADELRTTFFRIFNVKI